MSQLEEDIATILTYVRELPTREDLASSEARILAKLREFGTTVGGDIGRVVQRLDAIEMRRDNEAAAASRNGRPRPARVR